MSIVPTENLEVVRAMPADQQALAVTSMLTEARSWLAHAVEATGPETIANFKAQMATMAEASKQLGLSKEIQSDAVEMVRRAERGLGQSIRRGQDEGTVRSQGVGSKDNLSPTRTKLPSPYDFATKHELHGSGDRGGIYEISEPDDVAFETALAAAREEGNLSRANVTRKAREICGTTPGPKARKPLTDAFWTRLYDLGAKAESLHRLTEDDRWTQNAKKLATVKNRNELLRINDLLEQVINALPTEESTHA